MKGFLCCMFIANVALAGCNTDGDSVKRAPDGLNSPLAAVPAGQVVSGFKHGQLRTEFDVAAFSISKRPITLAQFRICVGTGPCRQPTATCANADGGEQDAALCVGFENARSYCAWSGGRLPRLNEWLFAARGRSPQRFSWGDGAPTCEQHALARVPFEQRRPLDARAEENDQTECGEPLGMQFRVGRHEAGASSNGLEDVLIAKGELLAGHAETNFGACRNDDRACVVFGLIPGAIDSVREISAPIAEGSQTQWSQASAEPPYSFRCVWSEEGA